MKKITTSLFLLITFCAFSQKNFLDTNYIEVIGTATMEVTPDEIYLQVSISEKNKKDKLTVERQEQQLLRELQQIGFDVKGSISVKDFDSYLTDYWLKKDEVIKTKNLELLIKDSAMLTKVFVILEKLELSNARVSHVSHSKIEDLRRDVRIEAIKAAKKKAQYLAEAVGESTGKALFIQELANTRGYENFGSNSAITTRAYGKKQIAIPNFNNISIEISIQTRFAIN